MHVYAQAGRFNKWIKIASCECFCIQNFANFTSPSPPPIKGSSACEKRINKNKVQTDSLYFLQLRFCIRNWSSSLSFLIQCREKIHEEFYDLYKTSQWFKSTMYYNNHVFISGKKYATVTMYWCILLYLPAIIRAPDNIIFRFKSNTDSWHDLLGRLAAIKKININTQKKQILLFWKYFYESRPNPSLLR